MDSPDLSSGKIRNSWAVSTHPGHLPAVAQDSMATLTKHGGEAGTSIIAT